MKTEFKIGDEIIIKSKPFHWASLLNKNSPIHLDIYPYKCTIQNIEKDGGYTAMTCGKYGWDLDSLIQDNLIRLQPKFEVGKWYKIFDQWYAKFKTIHRQGTFWQYNESITSKGNYDNISHNITMSDINAGLKIELLTDLSEIQQYLPDGHPDKIKPMEINEFKKGDYIVIVSGRKNCKHVVDNFIYKQITKSNALFAEIDNFGTPHRTTSVQIDNTLDKWRYATPEEIAEYNKLGKPYDVTTLNNNPEYLECIENSIDITLGKIYKVISSSENRFTIKDDVSTNTWSVNILQCKSFKPSTKEAYDRQELLEEAKRRYPVGTKFKLAHDSSKQSYVKHANYFWGTSNNIYCAQHSSGNDFDNFTYNGCIYSEGKWAEIISETKSEEWKPQIDDWVVRLNFEHLGIKEGQVCQIYEIDTLCTNQPRLKGQNVKEGSHSIDNLRKALPNEIPRQSNPCAEIKLPEFDFELPEKWCVRNTNMCLRPFADKIPNNPWCCNAEDNYYFYNESNYLDHNSNIPEGYTEITLEQFRIYVLKEKPNDLSGIHAPIKNYHATEFLTDYFIGVDPISNPKTHPLYREQKITKVNLK